MPSIDSRKREAEAVSQWRVFLATWYCIPQYFNLVLQAGIAYHSISQFSIDQCIGPVLAPCLFMSRETALQITFIGGPPMQSVIGKGLRWFAGHLRRPLSQGVVPLFGGPCLLPGMPPPLNDATKITFYKTIYQKSWVGDLLESFVWAGTVSTWVR